jgi:hypothetical protein
MSEEILRQLWKLRNDPFFPTLDAAGTALRPDALKRSLNPLLDARVLPFYFDIYDWNFSTLARDISPTKGLVSFPDPRTQPSDSAFMFLLLGCRESGLDSLANLILLKIKEVASGLEPLIVEVELAGREKAKNVATVAKLLLETLRNEGDEPPGLEKAVKKMQAAWDREYERQQFNTNADYSDVFQSFRNQLKDLIIRPLVLKIIAGGDNDSWVRIHNAVKRTCSHVIVMTPDIAYAKTAYNSMSTQTQNVAWIRAVPLTRDKAQQFLQQRLSNERVSGAVLPPTRPLLPFLTEAIDVLYEPGSGEKRTEALAHPVGWLRRMLYRALRDRLDSLVAAGVAAAALDLETTLIGAEQMKQAAQLDAKRI